MFPGLLGRFVRWLFRVGFVDRDYATLMRSALQRYKENAEGLPENIATEDVKTEKFTRVMGRAKLTETFTWK